MLLIIIKDYKSGFSNIKMLFFLGKNVLKLIELLESKVYNIDWYFIDKYT